MKKPPKINRFLLIALLCLWTFASVIASQFVVGWIMLLVIGKESFLQPVWTAVYSALSYTVALALVLFVPKRWLKISRNELGLTGWPTWTDVGLSPVAFVVSTLIAVGATAIFSMFPWFNVNEVQDVGFNNYIVGGDRIIAFITLVVVAPVAEEIIFRGWLYGKIREKVGVITSILIVSVLFGVVHMQWNVGVNVFCLSVVLCGLREITGTIYAGILTHMLKNGVAFYLLYIMGV